MTIEELRQYAERKLSENGTENARFEAKCLAEHLANDDGLERLDKLILRRIDGEPLQYILGVWEFYSLPFYVGEGVLIPRADTEILVDVALDLMKDIASPAVIDLCSGSGAVAIAIANARPDAKVFALEVSDRAIPYLKRNIELNRLQNVTVIEADLFRYETELKFDLMVSNPPYIKTDEMAALQKEVGFEPLLALDGGNDGLVFYREIATRWWHCLKDNGKIAVEIGYMQKDEVMDIFLEAGMKDIKCIKDYSKNNRVIIGTGNALL